MIVTGDHVGTHIDALYHVGNKGVLYDGIDAAEACKGGHFNVLGAETIEPMVCRGVFLDIPALKGTTRLEPVAYLGEATGVPGVGESGGKWSASHGVRATGGDTIAFDRVQLGPNFKQRPCHGIFLWENGIHIIEVMDLEELSREKVKEFLFILSPLKLFGATGSPVRPLAVVNV
ncbi:uncharacterized protein Z518_09781 [Rhinocladiella mackenziei CBS 650.93]|uniref:Cyclase n=1 Tax=Rhinocladiella mackenziei CBS 650.93 TaxID=1442369 RepID=A0A0D2IBR4_9EURO|nr:uncharacterized protein Z518_09781 [Rhinocladiella mackenziei CBS 650.93]KIX00716.1 hypothetical protein Z518_09781 [Rhinocladiella mackenziei CBS 650.93]